MTLRDAAKVYAINAKFQQIISNSRGTNAKKRDTYTHTYTHPLPIGIALLTSSAELKIERAVAQVSQIRKCPKYANVSITN